MSPIIGESRVFLGGSVGIVHRLQDDASLEIQIESLEAAMKFPSEVNVVILVALAQQGG